MNKQLKVSHSIGIETDAEKVWRVLTHPAYIKQYLFGTNTQTDWKVGSEIRFEGNFNGIEYKDKGIVQENIPHTKLSYLYWSGFSGLDDIPENYSLVTYFLTSQGAHSTELTWMQEGFSSEEGRTHSQLGLAGLLESIKSLAEGI